MTNFNSEIPIIITPIIASILSNNICNNIAKWKLILIKFLQYHS